MTDKRFDIARYLGTLPLFQHMDAAELARMAAGSRLRTFARGEFIFRVGMPCDGFHVTVNGQIKLFVVSPAGQEKVIELLAPGMSFAEALMFMGKPYLVNAQALTEVVVLSVDKETLVGEVMRNPRLALRMLAGLSQRLHGLVRDVQAYALHSGLKRVVSYLLNAMPSGPDGLDGPNGLDGSGGPGGPGGPGRPGGAASGAPGSGAFRVSLPVSKATLASRLSLTPEYFSRVLHELEARQLIRVDNRDIHILDADGLARQLSQ